MRSAELDMTSPSKLATYEELVAPMTFVTSLAPAAPEEPSREAAVDTARVLIVDDEPTTVALIRKYLRDWGYRHIATTTDATNALDLVKSERPDAILLDLKMPGLSGFDILQCVRSDGDHQHIPVLVLTADKDQETRHRALEYGATDFLTKPVDRTELLLRVRNALVVKAHHDHMAAYTEVLKREVDFRTSEVVASRRQVVHCLARAAEYRDSETGNHVLRVGRFVGIIARELGINEDVAELFEEAAFLHDVGKIAIRDAILLKPGSLSADERINMERHCQVGVEMLQPFMYDERNRPLPNTRGRRELIGHTSLLLTLAARIAQTHHEKWDGSGYPLGLAGEDIPIEGRITAAADVYDALSSRRPYKPPFAHAKCMAILEEGRGTHFDPKVLDALVARASEIERVRAEFGDLA